MSSPQKAPYGTWKSPVTADVLTESSVTVESVLIDNFTREIYHIEKRATGGGRSVLVKTKENKDVVEHTWNVRTAVHEYGGGAAIVSGGVAYFSHYKDGKVYRTQSGGTPVPITPDEAQKTTTGDTQFIVQLDPSILVAILEDHTNPHSSAVVNKLVVIDASSRSVDTIAEGADFYSSPALSPNGRKISWIQWHHPDMPWDGSELVIADVIWSGTSIKLKNPQIIAGRQGEVSVDQPQLASDDTLIFLNDTSGYLTPWSYSLRSSQAGPLFSDPIAADFEEPAWVLGRSTYAILDPNMTLFAPTRDGRSVLLLADLRSGSFKSIPAPYVNISL